MKGTFFIAVLVIFSMLVIPLSSLNIQKEPSKAVANTLNDVVYEKADRVTGFEKIKVLKDGEILEYSSKDYIFGVVAAEMPALYEKEALKAQAVAAYTFACYQKSNNKNAQYDITTDAKTAQCFITRDEALTRWGDKAQEYAKKLDDCISEVIGQILIFNNQPIFAAYHAISPGLTNSCADVWGSDLTYLKSVSSAGDSLADGYLSEATFTAGEIAEKLKSVTAPSGDAQNYFTDIKTTGNGYVKSVNYCGKQITGSDIVETLELRSGNFEIKFSDNNFTFLVKGYGHGVGMSQTGANYMAQQGSSYEEILLHYYDGATLQKN